MSSVTWATAAPEAVEEQRPARKPRGRRPAAPAPTAPEPAEVETPSEPEEEIPAATWITWEPTGWGRPQPSPQLLN